MNKELRLEEDVRKYRMSHGMDEEERTPRTKQIDGKKFLLADDVDASYSAYSRDERELKETAERAKSRGAIRQYRIIGGRLYIRR